MAQLYCTGPAHAYVTLGGVGPAYLGTCEDAPDIDIKPLYNPVRNDIGGETPFDFSFQGEHALIALGLNRYNESVYSAVAARPRFTGARGLNGPGDVGSLVLTEGNYCILYLLFQFGANGSAPKLAMTAGGMPPGYRFLATFPIGPDGLKPLGTRPRKVNLLFYALRTWSPQSQSFALYDSNVAGLPPIN